MLKRIAFVALLTGITFGPLAASADSAFPKDNSNDYAAPFSVSERDGAFPRDNSNDYGIRIAATDGDSVYPRDNSNDYGVIVAA